MLHVTAEKPVPRSLAIEKKISMTVIARLSIRTCLFAGLIGNSTGFAQINGRFSNSQRAVVFLSL